MGALGAPPPQSLQELSVLLLELPEPGTFLRPASPPHSVTPVFLPPKPLGLFNHSARMPLPQGQRSDLAPVLESSNHSLSLPSKSEEFFALLVLAQNPRLLQLKEERFILVHGFRGFSPLLAGSKARTACQKGMREEGCSPR